MSVVNSRRLLILVLAAIVMIVAVLASTLHNGRIVDKNGKTSAENGIIWQPPDTALIPFTSEGMLIRYGRDLIANTSYYLGPKGIVGQVTNGMNCQNCHLEAGTKSWGNNYGAVFSTYPKFRERSGTIEDIYRRVNDCIDRSLNGHPIDTNSREMQAITAYIAWIGAKVPKGVKPFASGIRDLPFMDYAANPDKGKTVYVGKCQRCHGKEGEGLLSDEGKKYTYPPLWGDNSYNTGAGLYRLSRFAGYARDNMPFDAPNNSAPLTDDEAWDVAAFVNSQPRPGRDLSKDYPNIAGKPFDHPFGPYKDNFTEYQHKYGPFVPIVSARTSK
jgi:thiosulfate dehydrogenase